LTRYGSDLVERKREYSNIRQAFCVAYQPFLKNARSRIWPAARQRLVNPQSSDKHHN
jgi:hypothetical protein